MPRPYSAWFSRTANLCLDVLEDRMVPASFQGLSSLLGPMGGSLSTNISANGLVVVGSSHNGAYEEAFRWTTAGGMVGLGSIPTGTNSGANAVSEDGTVVVGYSDHNGIAQDAFRWTPTGGMVGLGSLSGLIYFSALATT